MTVTTRKGLHLVSALVIALAFVLSGCKIDGTVEIQADGGTKIDLTFEDADGKMAEIDNSCEGLRLSFEARLTFVTKPQMKNVTPSGGPLTCRLTSNEPLGGKVRFTENKNTYSFNFPGAQTGGDDYSEFKTRITVKMPGKILKTSRGEIDRNKVVVNSLDFLKYGLSISSEKTDTTSDSPSAANSPAKKASIENAKKSDGGFPVWVWGLVGAGVCAAVVGVVPVAVRRQGRGAAGGPYPRQGR